MLPELELKRNFKVLILRTDFLWWERTTTVTFSKLETNETTIKIPKLIVREAVMDLDRDNHDWVKSTQVGFAEFNNTADNRANIGGTIIGAPIVGQ